MLELRGPGSLVYIAEPGLLDERATLAFINGQCHGLALAVHAWTGFPLVAMFDADGTCIHVCVRDRERLIDITGEHDEAEFRREGAFFLRAVDPGFVDALASEHGWAHADPLAAEAWVQPVLDRVSRGEQLRPLHSSTMIVTGPVTDTLELRVAWVGEPHIDAYVRRPGETDADWTVYACVALPPDGAGLHRIDFRAEVLEALVSGWVERQFDPSRAETELAASRR